MSTQPYTPPVGQLLTYGAEDVARAAEWPDYLALGLGPEDIPELIRMATEPALQQEEASDLEFFAALHAMRALGQLKAEAAIEPLLTLFDIAPDNEWMQEDMPRVYGMIGPAAIPALSAFLNDTAHSVYNRAYVANSLAEIARQHPEARSQAVAAITQQLAQFEQNDEELNAFLINDIAHLKEVEALPLIEQVLEANKVDTSVTNLDYVLEEMGLKEREEPEIDLNAFFANPTASRGTPFDPASIQLVPPDASLLPASASFPARASHLGSASKKEKNKRKMAKQSRKKNKRRK
jgi:hypothetical protein